MTEAIRYEELVGLVGRTFTSDWRRVRQEDVNLFAEATGDHQWIHVDVERARRESPYGGTIAHGYFSLSLVPALLFETLAVTGASALLNYGANKLRFPAPVPVGSRVRGVFTVAAVEPVSGGTQVTMSCLIEVEGGAKPAMAAEILFRWLA